MFYAGYVLIALFFLVLAILILSKPKHMPTPKVNVIVPTATPSATLAPLRNTPLFNTQTGQGGQVPTRPSQQSSSTTTSTTNTSTTNNSPAPTQAQGQSPVNKILDDVKSLLP